MSTASIKARLVEKEKGEVPDVKQFPIIAKDKEWMEAVKEKRELDAIKKWAEARLKELSPVIEVGLMAADTPGVKWNDCVVKIGRGRSGDRIVSTKLAELGVSLDTIAAATVEGQPYTFAQIVTPKGDIQFASWEEVNAAAEKYGFGQ